MAIFPLGAIIRNRREELGLTQEDLADGVCSVPTLSRIENGERIPTKNHLEMLLQRLGYSAMSLDYYTDNLQFRISELKFKVRQSYVARDYIAAKKYLDECIQAINSAHGTKNPSSPIDTQFILLYDVLLNKATQPTEERLQQLETAIQLTCRKQYSDRIFYVLSYEEILLLNGIAISYAKLGEFDQAISILFSLKDYYTRHVVSLEEALRTQPLIIYSLSKYLGQCGRYDECIEVCDQGIRIAKESGRAALIHKILYNRAWAMLKRDDPGDKLGAKQTLRRAFYASDLLGKNDDANHIKSYYATTFGEELSV